MNATVIEKFGDFDVLQYKEVETPKIKEGHLLIKILASGVNRLEHYIREGSVLNELTFPHILGSDAAGEIVEVGNKVNGFKIGDRVIPMPGYPLSDADKNVNPMMVAPSYAIGGIAQWGTYAEYILVPAEYVLRDDTGLAPEEVATLPMVLVTGVHAVKEKGNVKKDDYVLIQAGSSGTGSMNIQIAKALGAKVATTIDDETKREFVASLGADLIVNIKEKDFVGEIIYWTNGKGADVVIDNLGGDVLEKSIQAVKPTGVVVAMGFVAGVHTTFHVRNFFFAHKTIKGTLMGTVADFKLGLEMVQKGLIKPQLDRVLPLRDANEAHRLLAGNTIKGNIVLKP
jgi:NADPH:quinone reductase